MKRFVGLLVVPLLGCTFGDNTCEGQNDPGFRCSILAESSGEASTGDACFADDPAAIVRIENRTGNAIEVVYFVRCDSTDASEFPLMPPGLPSGMDVEIPLPGPGCWLLDYSGEGCEADTPYSTETDVCAGDTYVWTPDESRHVCTG